MTSKAQSTIGWPAGAPLDQARRRAVASNFGRRDYLIRRLLLLSDVASIALALLVMVLVSARADNSPHLLVGLLFVPVWLTVLGAYGLYTRDIKRISHSTVDDIPWILHAVLVMCLLTWIYFKALPISKLMFSDILVLGSFAALFMLVLRTVTRRLTAVVLGPERVLFIGGDDRVDLLSRKMAAHPEYRLAPVGVVGERYELEEALIRYQPERVVVGDTSSLDETELVELMHRCKEHSLKVSLLPHLFTALGPSVEIDDLEGITVLGINPPVLPRSSRYLKRGLDLALSALILFVTAPLLALIAIAIRLESRGPVFFKQRRIGREGEPFHLIKFRTMVMNAEDRTEELFTDSADVHWLKLEHDPRVTRVGRLLRLTSLDELPQLWNILRGDMSLVGPRPLIESEDRQIAGWARSRLELTPGLTGLWQVLGRTNIPFEEMVKLDYMYVTNWSLWSDIRLILRTLPAVVARRGAN